MIYQHKIGVAKHLTAKLCTLGAIFVLVAQPLYGIVTNKAANALSGTIHTDSSNISSWNFSETRTKGHNELVAGGLHVWTDSNDSLSKAAGYYATSGLSLSDVSETSIEFLTYSGGRPSVQLGVDRDGNGSWDGYLVYEPWAYGNGQYWVDKDGFGVPAGGGYKSMGTLAQYQAANPAARITAIGYSLGSGVKGDAVISKITIGERSYTFGLTPPAAPTGLNYAATNQTCGGFTNVNHAQPVWNAVPGAASYDYQALFNGSVVFAANYTTNQHPGGSFGGGENGVWGFQVRAVDTNGLRSAWSTACNITLDTLKPAAHITSPATDGQSLPANPTVTGIVDASEVNLKSHWFEITNPDGSLSYENVPNAASLSHSFTLNTSKGSGTYKVRYVATDKAGNRSDDPSYTNATVRVMNVDASKPTIYVNGKGNTFTPASLGDFATDIYRNVSFKFFDSQKVDKYVLNGHTVDFTNNNWSDAIYANIKSKLVQGANTITVYDVAGNESSLVFTYDSVAPTATITHSNNNDNTLVNTDVTSTLHASEPIQTPDGWTRVDDVTFTKVSTVNNKGTLTLTDIAGNTGSVFFEVKRIDKTAPAFNITNGDAFNSSSVEVIATEDNISTITVDGVTTPYTGSKPNYKVTVAGEGSHTVTATDKAGNSASVTFAIDHTAPVVTIHAPEAGKTYHGPLEFVATIEDENLSHYWLTITKDGADYTIPGLTKTRNTASEVRFTLGQDGIYTVKLEARDKAGNKDGSPSSDGVSVKTIQFAIDSTVNINLSETEFTSSTPTVTGTATYAVDGSPAIGITLTLVIDGIDYTVTTDSDSNWSLPVTQPLENNVYPVTGIVNGRAFNAGSITIVTNPAVNPGGSTDPSTPGGTSSQPIDASDNAAEDTSSSAPAQLFQNFAAVFNDDGTVSAVPTSDGDATDNGEVLGATDTFAQNAANQADAKNGLSLLGIDWYWIVAAALALLAAFWWFIAGKRRKKDEQTQ